MALIKELKLQSIVILAQSFNPSIFNRHWLIVNNYIAEQDIQPNSMFLPGITNLFTNKFNLLVAPEQLQLSSNLLNHSLKEDIDKSLLPIIEKLKEIPYKAVGVNFTWLVSDSEKDFSVFNRELFYVNESKLHQSFDTDNSRFGAYMSKNYGSSRLKLDIKPINGIDQQTGKKSEYLQFGFNFHIDLQSENNAQHLIDELKVWEKYKTESERTINLL